MSELWLHRAIEVDELWEGYRPQTAKGWRRGDMKWALKGVSFEVGKGEILGVIGRNGSGKSTLLKCIGGILRPNKGQVRTAGRAVALIDLLAGFHRELTGRENLSVVAAMNGMSRKELALRYSDIVDFAELSEKVMDSPLLTYSAGMTLRLGFSVVIHADPAVLLVDEVLAVGDEAFRLKCLHRISELLGRGSAGVMVSHDLNLVPETCDRVMVLHEGRNVFLGPVGEAIDFYLELTKAFPEDDLSGSGPTEGVGLS